MTDPNLEGLTIKEVTASFSMTINIGNYENMKPEISMTAEVSKGQDPHEVQKALSKYVRKEISETQKYIKGILEGK